MARVYSDVNQRLGKAWYDYENSKIEWSQPDRYEIVRRVGGGRYSEVFEGVDTSGNDLCVIKVLKPVAKSKVKREIKVLRNLTGGPNIIGLIDVVRDPSHRYASLIFELVDSFTDWKTFSTRMTEADVKFYTFQLLVALDFVHAHGIMHRDVKPGNIVIDHSKRKLRLIDWGLAEFYHPGTEYHIRVGSRYYKAPELLVGFRTYDYSLDLWSVGCILASFIFKREHFFRGADNNDMILRHMKALGSEKFDHYLQKYDIHFETDAEALLSNYPKRQWTDYGVNELVTGEAIDLLDKLLRYDHAERLTAREAQAHVYFNTVRLDASAPKEGHVSDSGFCST
ncbi:Pkinase-domain-containing protein [Cylindrobasidium torrendii FP15055 ss-10]|uniref:Casein kinase II subunit alpha n=1 Tax=Cylindrobasidium torrendii FP15055 ss-10 TaxID=1314674 RepID=A0A0D7B970_9AGAR|nr:Pkinase-domain-containing protein [Cylindrobasidium torrendii FP15055 ss-10]